VKSGSFVFLVFDRIRKNRILCAVLYADLNAGAPCFQLSTQYAPEKIRDSKRLSSPVIPFFNQILVLVIMIMQLVIAALKHDD